MRATMMIALVLAAVAAGAGERQYLWPEGKMPDVRPNQIAAPSEVAWKKDFKADENRRPYLEWSEQPNAAKRTDACMILISGGGYGCTCDGPAFRPLEKLLLDNGITCVWLWYRTPRPQGLEIYRSGWEDGQRAVRLVRAAAKQRGFDPEKIGALGCSAGSHLALMLATSALTPAYKPVDALDATSCAVQWAVAIYPAYALTDGLDQNNATGGNADSARLAPEFSFDLATCPILFIHGDADGWAAMNSVKCWEQLRRMGIQGDLHTLALRPHCFQAKANPGTGSYTWLDRIGEFMARQGVDR